MMLFLHMCDIVELGTGKTRILIPITTVVTFSIGFAASSIHVGKIDSLQEMPLMLSLYKKSLASPLFFKSREAKDKKN